MKGAPGKLLSEQSAHCLLSAWNSQHGWCKHLLLQEGMEAEAQNLQQKAVLQLHFSPSSSCPVETRPVCVFFTGHHMCMKYRNHLLNLGGWLLSTLWQKLLFIISTMTPVSAAGNNSVLSVEDFQFRFNVSPHSWLMGWLKHDFELESHFYAFILLTITILLLTEYSELHSPHACFHHRSKSTQGSDTVSVHSAAAASRGRVCPRHRNPAKHPKTACSNLFAAKHCFYPCS